MQSLCAWSALAFQLLIRLKPRMGQLNADNALLVSGLVNFVVGQRGHRGRGILLTRVRTLGQQVLAHGCQVDVVCKQGEEVASAVVQSCVLSDGIADKCQWEAHNSAD